MWFCSSLVFLTITLAGHVAAQESANQNQSDTLINKRIYLPLQTGENQSFCPQYVPEGSSQWEYMYALVYRAFTGQYKPNANPSIYQAQGILNSSAFYRDPIGNTNKVNLLPWFDGSLVAANRCGRPTAVKLVNGNGTRWEDGQLKITATPAMDKMLLHLTAMMGVILGCDQQSFPPYAGRSSQFEVHRFMNIPQVEMHYFIHNIYDSALTSGISQPDGIIIGTALDNLFNKKCSPARKIATYQSVALQDMCTHDGCAQWAFKNATCAPYNVTGFGQEPARVDSGKTTPTGTSDSSECAIGCPQQTGAGVWGPSVGFHSVTRSGMTGWETFVGHPGPARQTPRIPVHHVGLGAHGPLYN